MKPTNIVNGLEHMSPTMQLLALALEQGVAEGASGDPLREIR